MAETGPSTRAGGSLLRRLAREPLLHFAVLGGVLVAIHAALGGGEPSRHVVVDASVRDVLRQEHARRTGTPPTPEEERQLVERYVDDEVLYREALALGLDRGDTIVRRRLLQKMEFLAEESDPIAEPSAADLEAYLAAHAADYAVEPRVAIVQVFVSADRHGERAEEVAHRMAEKLATGADPSTVGDPFPRGREFGPSTERELAGVFGSDFAARAMTLPDGVWSAPLRSSYGLHLVRPTARTPGGMARLEEVRSRVRLDWLEKQREERRRAALDALRARYSIDLDP